MLGHPNLQICRRLGKMQLRLPRGLNITPGRLHSTRLPEILERLLYQYMADWILARYTRDQCGLHKPTRLLFRTLSSLQRLVFFPDKGRSSYSQN